MHQVKLMTPRWALALLLVTALVACGGARPTPTSTRSPTAEPARPGRPPSRPAPSSSTGSGPVRVGAVFTGWAVWYGSDFHGKPTASGERYNMHGMTAAHRTLPLGTRVRATNTRNGRAVVVRINDRGPFGKRRERIIDLSRAAAATLGILDAGTCPIRLEVLYLPPPKQRRR